MRFFLPSISLVKLAPDSVSVAGRLTYQKWKRKKSPQHKALVMRELIMDLLYAVLPCLALPCSGMVWFYVALLGTLQTNLSDLKLDAYTHNTRLWRMAIARCF